jgi:hypothetical protein
MFAHETHHGWQSLLFRISEYCSLQKFRDLHFSNEIEEEEEEEEEGGQVEHSRVVAPVIEEQRVIIVKQQ